MASCQTRAGLQNVPFQHKIFPTNYDINSPSVIITLSHGLETVLQATKSGRILLSADMKTDNTIHRG